MRVFVIVAVTFILAAWLGWVIGLPFPRTDIEQTVEIGDVCLDTYKVSTQLWIYRYGSLILDTWYSNGKIKCSDVQLIKIAQMKAVKERCEVVEKCLKDFKYCDD